jgi:carbon-monoxide dehydrogenase medium subunit
MLAFRVAQPTLLVDLRKLAELKGIRIGKDGVRLGALARWRDIEDDARLEAIAAQGGDAHVAHYRIRPRHGRGQPRARRSGRRIPGIASAGGNLGAGSAGRASSAPPISVSVRSPHSSRQIIVNRLPAWPKRRSASGFARRRRFAMAARRCSTTDAGARRPTPMSA